MAKPKHPLFSFGAIGRLGEALTFLRRRHTDIVEKTPIPEDVKSPGQLSWRHMYQKAVALWHALSAAEKQEWESQARPKHMTGFAWFMSQALKPNPGLYLPLQGGTMSGDIDMAKNRILKLPAPVDGQEADTLTARNLAIAAHAAIANAHHPLDIGARVYHDASQSIADSTFTTLAFNSQRWDTDTIHNPAVKNSRLTCKTAGKYAIMASIEWSASGVGRRDIRIRLNGATSIANIILEAIAVINQRFFLATIYDLAFNDYVECQVYHTATVAVSVVSEAQYSPEFMMQRIP